MATLISRSAINFTGNWALVEAGSAAYLDSEAASQNVTTTPVDSAGFTGLTSIIDGIAVKVATKIASPTGTVSIILRNTTDSIDERTVTVNVADLASETTTTFNASWHFFKFGSTITLNGAKTYAVRVVASVSNECALYRNATSGNWSRLLSTTTTQAAAVNDQLIIVGELTGAGAGADITVTMDNTGTTTYGNTTFTQGIHIGKRGILNWGVAASTNYYLRVRGIMLIGHGGKMNMGTTASKLPITSTHTLEFDAAAAVDSGLRCWHGHEWNAESDPYPSATTWKATLNADEAASQTVINDIGDTTGMAANDEVAFASTSQTGSQAEKKTIATVDSGIQITLSAGLTNAHSGTAPTKCHILHLTRRILIKGISSTLTGFVFIAGNATVKLRYVQFTNLGSSTTDKRGVELNALASGKTVDIQFCTIHDLTASGAIGFYIKGNCQGTLTFKFNGIYNTNDRNLYMDNVSSTNWTIEDCTFIRSTVTAVVELVNLSGTFKTIRASSADSDSDSVNINTPTAAGTHDFDGIEAHSSGTGIRVGGCRGLTLKNLKLWRSSSGNGGLEVAQSTRDLFVDVAEIFGNLTCSIGLNNSVGVRLRSVTSNGDTTFATLRGIFLVTNGGSIFDCNIESCDFSTVTGIKVAHTDDILLQDGGNGQFGHFYAFNSKFGGTSIFSPATQHPESFLVSLKHGQTAGDHRVFHWNCVRKTDTSIFNTASPSERITPSTATPKSKSSSFTKHVNNSQAVTFTVQVRKSSAGDGAAYNGAEPRLILRRNPALGINNDVVLDTVTVATGTWESLTGASAAVSGDGVLEAYVDLDGTAGWVNVDDFSAVAA